MTPNSIFTTGVCVKYTAMAFILGPMKGIFEIISIKAKKHFEMQSHFCSIKTICLGREFIDTLMIKATTSIVIQRMKTVQRAVDKVKVCHQ